MDARQQLADEMSARIHSVSSIVDASGALEARAASALSGSLDRIIAEASEADGAIPLMDALWGSSAPDAAWWATPLGKLVGVHFDDISVTQQEAADLRGVTRGTIAQEVHRGTLRKGVDGKGVVVSDIVRKLGQEQWGCEAR